MTLNEFKKLHVKSLEHRKCYYYKDHEIPEHQAFITIPRTVTEDGRVAREHTIGVEGVTMCYVWKPIELNDLIDAEYDYSQSEGCKYIAVVVCKQPTEEEIMHNRVEHKLVSSGMSEDDIREIAFNYAVYNHTYKGKMFDFIDLVYGYKETKTYFIFDTVEGPIKVFKDLVDKVYVIE